jgi:murein DD-endopeptidase MepM/ murein hydrolase activator NlpD
MAGTTEAGTRAAQKKWDYSRFSDGPRRVPEPRGASLRRAKRLGLGTRQAAKHLLHEPPKARWRAAAPGDAESLRWPVDEGRYGRGFGFVRRRRPDLRHDGIDVVAEEKTVVRAIADGIVAYSDNGIRGFGNCVLIVHPNGWVSVYAHNYRTTVQAGWRVRRGERIALLGHTGIARGPHLHFELLENGREVDPMPRFEERGTGHADLERWYKRTGRRPSQKALARRPEADEGTAGEAERESRPARDASDRTDDGEVSATEQLPGALDTVRLARRVIAEPVGPDTLDALRARRFSDVLWPVRGGQLERRFHPRRHRGVDIGAEPGTAVRAAADGLVVYAGEDLHGVGKAIVMLHRNGWVTLYGSNRRLHVEAGDRIRRGEWIAQVGSSGSAEGAHLHFELHDAGDLRDPAPLLAHVPDDAR